MIYHIKNLNIQVHIHTPTHPQTSVDLHHVKESHKNNSHGNKYREKLKNLEFDSLQDIKKIY